MNSKKSLMERRDFLKLGVTGAFGLTVTVNHLLWHIEQVQAAELPSTNPQSLSPNAALEKLMSRNKRFVQHQPQHPDQFQRRLQSGQLKIVGGRYDLDTGDVSILQTANS